MHMQHETLLKSENTIYPSENIFKTSDFLPSNLQGSCVKATVDNKVLYIWIIG